LSELQLRYGPAGRFQAPAPSFSQFPAPEAAKIRLSAP
jgi:hypothetical protein